MNYIDLRSDTVTRPTEEMRKAMYNSEVGDDVYEDDTTVKLLEEYTATLVNKEAALFVPTGTFGNQLALFTHCIRGTEVILEENCHILQHEVGAPAIIAGVQLRPLKSNKGEMNPSEVEKTIRGEDIHFPETSLICVENAHSNGRVLSIQNMKEIYEVAKNHNLPVHLDGARLFNAAASLGVDAKEITKYCDSVMFCLSKGLCAPIGSMLAGSKEFISKARKKRKIMGGGMRQTGILAAAGMVALKDMRQHLKVDHENAEFLGEELSKIPGINVKLDQIHINMVFFSIEDLSIDGKLIVDEFYKKGIKINPPENGEFRFVTNYWVNKEHINMCVDILKQLLNVK
ncbi:low-specificity L-threonine aldolase [Clostridium peptidivorans]|uniref:low-specificity L-threonine aldolase n=1 Tax=Clostridium peptidivorans TaxID=100174 RepID=UPI000BE3368F|nr:low-specificity L-threonine aldolase [Clostridium peptidivorans]